MRGLDSGSFGEASEGVHVHELIQVVAQSRLRAVGLQKEEFVLVERVRKQLGVAMWLWEWGPD